MTVDKSNQRVRRMFGQIAPNYDRMNHLLSMNVDHYWRWRTVRRVFPNGDAPILDICTGTGDLAFAFHKKAKPGTVVVAADFCREMLDIGQTKQVKRGITETELQFMEADAQQLPFANDTFQIVSVAFGLRNVANTQTGLSEMARVCRPGGRVAVLEFSEPRWQPFRGIYRWYFHNILPRVGQWFAKNDHDAYSYLPESVGEFPQGEALAEHFREVGLKDVRYYPLTMGIATLYVGTK